MAVTALVSQYTQNGVHVEFTTTVTHKDCIPVSTQRGGKPTVSERYICEIQTPVPDCIYTAVVTIMTCAFTNTLQILQHANQCSSW